MQKAKIVVFKDGSHSVVRKEDVPGLQQTPEWLCTIALSESIDTARKIYPPPVSHYKSNVSFKFNPDDYEDDNWGGW